MFRTWQADVSICSDNGLRHSLTVRYELRCGFLGLLVVDCLELNLTGQYVSLWDMRTNACFDVQDEGGIWWDQTGVSTKRELAFSMFVLFIYHKFTVDRRHSRWIQISIMVRNECYHRIHTQKWWEQPSRRVSYRIVRRYQWCPHPSLSIISMRVAMSLSYLAFDDFANTDISDKVTTVHWGIESICKT